jgi:hypothetical protein
MITHNIINFICWYFTYKYNITMNVRSTAERELCSNIPDYNQKDKCRRMISDIYKEGFQKGSQENGYCLTSIPSMFNFGQSNTQPLQQPQKFKLPSQDNIVCNRTFNLFDKTKFNPMIQSMIPENKTLTEYFKMVNIKIDKDTLDFSNMYYIKLSSVGIERIKEIISKLRQFNECEILENITKIYFYNQNFRKEHFPLLPFIFENFPNVTEIHFGVQSNIVESDLNCPPSIKCDLVRDQNGYYILATKMQGGKRKRRRTNRRKRDKKRSYRRTKKS